MNIFESIVARLRSDPRIIVEEVEAPSKWRPYLSKYANESTVDEFLLWAKHNKPIISDFVNKTLEHLKNKEEVSAITITDEINCNHNRSRLLSVVCMAIAPATKGYFKLREVK